MVMGSFVAACCGAILLIGWLANKTASGLLMWGTANFLTSAGLFSLTFGIAQHESLFFVGGSGLLALAHGLIWKGARALDARPAPFALALAGLALLALGGIVPATRPFGALLGLSIGAAYLFAAASSLWRGRAERLPARRPLIAFVVTHAAVTLIGAFGSFGGGDVTQIPPLMSLFGVIYFESNIFAVGTTAFVLMLVKERSEAASRLAATVDSLTGIANRAAFVEAATRIIDRCRIDGAPVSVIMFDLDKFKSINDEHGHAAGDAVIRRFCDVTTAALRPKDAFGRLGGEEFAVVSSSSSIEPAVVRADRIRSAFEEACRIVEDQAVNATVSAGVSVSVNGDMAIGALLKLSDQALYAAKAAGRNRVKRADELDSNSQHSAIIRVA